MATPYIKVNNTAIPQPSDENLTYKMEVTDSQTTTRTMAGHFKGSPLFTVEAFDIVLTNLNATDCSNVLKNCIRTKTRPTFSLYYFSPYYGSWRTDTFYCTAVDINVKSVKDNNEKLTDISMSWVGVNPVTPR